VNPSDWSPATITRRSGITATAVTGASQKTLTADKQKATQNRQVALKRPKERLIYLRAAIWGDIGPRTEKLGDYGITPLRKRRGKAKPAGEGESS
jgi:hypothetical protein